MSRSGGANVLVRRTHEQRVLRLLREWGALSRGQIASRVGLSRTTLSEIAGDLLARGAIVVVDTDASRRTGSGRPAELLALDPSAGQFMGVDLGHIRVRIAVAGASHEVIAAGHSQYDAGSSWHQRLASTFDLIDRISAESGVTFAALQGIGVGVCGPRSASWAGDRFGMGTARTMVREMFTARFGVPVIIDNNTRFAALAEVTTDESDVRDLMYLRLSDGIGGGLVVGGRLVYGGDGVAGEFGHVSVDPDGATCRCGNRGCLETVASVPAVLRACAHKGLALADLDGLKNALAQRKRAAVEALADTATAVGRVLAAAAVVLNPVQIVIGGSLARGAPEVVALIRAVVEAELGRSGGSPLVRPAHLDDDDGALGAIAALFHQSPVLAGYPDAAGEAQPPPPPPDKEHVNGSRSTPRPASRSGE